MDAKQKTAAVERIILHSFGLALDENRADFQTLVPSNTVVFWVGPHVPLPTLLRLAQHKLLDDLRHPCTVHGSKAFQLVQNAAAGRISWESLFTGAWWCSEQTSDGKTIIKYGCSACGKDNGHHCGQPAHLKRSPDSSCWRLPDGSGRRDWVTYEDLVEFYDYVRQQTAPADQVERHIAQVNRRALLMSTLNTNADLRVARCLSQQQGDAFHKIVRSLQQNLLYLSDENLEVCAKRMQEFERTPFPDWRRAPNSDSMAGRLSQANAKQLRTEVAKVLTDYRLHVLVVSVPVDHSQVPHVFVDGEQVVMDKTLTGLIGETYVLYAFSSLNTVFTQRLGKASGDQSNLRSVFASRVQQHKEKGHLNGTPQLDHDQNKPPVLSAHARLKATDIGLQTQRSKDSVKANPVTASPSVQPSSVKLSPSSRTNQTSSAAGPTSFAIATSAGLARGAGAHKSGFHGHAWQPNLSTAARAGSSRQVTGSAKSTVQINGAQLSQRNEHAKDHPPAIRGMPTLGPLPSVKTAQLAKSQKPYALPPGTVSSSGRDGTAANVGYVQAGHSVLQTSSSSPHVAGGQHPGSVLHKGGLSSLPARHREHAAVQGLRIEPNSAADLFQGLNTQASCLNKQVVHGIKHGVPQQLPANAKVEPKPTADDSGYSSDVVLNGETKPQRSSPAFLSSMPLFNPLRDGLKRKRRSKPSSAVVGPTSSKAPTDTSKRIKVADKPIVVPILPTGTGDFASVDDARVQTAGSPKLQQHTKARLPAPAGLGGSSIKLRQQNRGHPDFQDEADRHIAEDAYVTEQRNVEAHVPAVAQLSQPPEGTAQRACSPFAPPRQHLPLSLRKKLRRNNMAAAVDRKPVETASAVISSKAASSEVPQCNTAAPGTVATRSTAPETETGCPGQYEVKQKVTSIGHHNSRDNTNTAPACKGAEPQTLQVTSDSELDAKQTVKRCDDSPKAVAAEKNGANQVAGHVSKKPMEKLGWLDCLVPKAKRTPSNYVRPAKLPTANLWSATAKHSSFSAAASCVCCNICGKPMPGVSEASPVDSVLRQCTACSIKSSELVSSTSTVPKSVTGAVEEPAVHSRLDDDSREDPGPRSTAFNGTQGDAVEEPGVHSRLDDDSGEDPGAPQGDESTPGGEQVVEDTLLPGAASAEEDMDGVADEQEDMDGIADLDPAASAHEAIEQRVNETRRLRKRRKVVYNMSLLLNTHIHGRCARLRKSRTSSCPPPGAQSAEIEVPAIRRSSSWDATLPDDLTDCTSLFVDKLFLGSAEFRIQKAAQKLMLGRESDATYEQRMLKWSTSSAEEIRCNIKELLLPAKPDSSGAADHAAAAGAAMEGVGSATAAMEDAGGIEHKHSGSVCGGAGSQHNLSSGQPGSDVDDVPQAVGEQAVDTSCRVGSAANVSQHLADTQRPNGTGTAEQVSQAEAVHVCELQLDTGMDTSQKTGIKDAPPAAGAAIALAGGAQQLAAANGVCDAATHGSCGDKNIHKVEEFPANVRQQDGEAEVCVEIRVCGDGEVVVHATAGPEVEPAAVAQQYDSSLVDDGGGVTDAAPAGNAAAKEAESGCQVAVGSESELKPGVDNSAQPAAVLLMAGNDVSLSPTPLAPVALARPLDQSAASLSRNNSAGVAATSAMPHHSSQVSESRPLDSAGVSHAESAATHRRKAFARQIPEAAVVLPGEGTPQRDETAGSHWVMQGASSAGMAPENAALPQQSSPPEVTHESQRAWQDESKHDGNASDEFTKPFRPLEQRPDRCRMLMLSDIIQRAATVELPQADLCESRRG